MTEYTESEILFIYPRILIFCPYISTEERVFTILNVYKGCNKYCCEQIHSTVCPYVIYGECVCLRAN